MNPSRRLITIILIGCLMSVGGPWLGNGEPAPPNGIVKEYYPTGKIRLEFRYKNGLLRRKRVWYKNGHLMCDYVFQDGQPYIKKDYYENGRLKSSWSRESGVLQFFHDDGTLKASVSSRGEGLFH